ncbi:MAG: glycoside hydrolase family 97 N-terminal domain-containing protein, partial [Candidatus Marinimicrobia bacterium]|nr:glycoside hydrolase family 97 N-terminal domain-containing protein [Candidatus Neomarinimicrobiota bacterium]MCF7840653.1 glycoside hydrolase family 97 N-terminal domain-containing protein [Candidatus Neomarinimicrobiota bacterium]
MMIRQSLTHIFLLSVIMMVFLTQSCSRDAKTVITSPDTGVEVKFSLSEKGVPYYAVNYAGGKFILPSRLGFILKNTPPLLEDFQISNVRKRSVDETWTPVWGQTDTVRNHFTELVVELEESGEPFRRMSLEFRVYNDGAAFRYILPDQPGVER